MATVTIKHASLTGAAANPAVLVDGPKWDAGHTVTGLENVDNTSDVNKPISTATQAALDAKATGAASALTRVSDTNVVLTLGGTPATSLLQATSITVSWSGTLAATRGGFGADVSASSGVPLFAAGVPTFTGTTGTGNFVRATTPTLVTPVLGAATGTSVVLGGTDILPTITNKATVSVASALGAVSVGQDTTHGLAMVWTFNATPASATAAINTSGYSNPLTIDASTLTLQSLSSGSTAVYNGGVAPTGTGAYVLASSPTLTTPTIGAATATSVNKVTITAPASSAIITIANGKTATVSNTLTFTGTDSSSIAFGAGGTIGSVGYATVGQIPGETSTGSATAGNVGERKDSSVVFGSAVSLTNNTPLTVTSITLTAGDWEVSGVVALLAGATTNVTYVIGSINTTTNVLDSATPGRFSNTVFSSAGIVPPNGVAFTQTLAATRFSVSTNTAVFLVAQGGFTVSTLVAYGEIHAVRIR